MRLAAAFGRSFVVSLIGGRECQSGDGEFNLHLPGRFRMVRRGVAFMRRNFWSLKPGCEMCPKLGNLSAVDNEAGLSRDPRPRPAFKWIVRGIH